LVAAGAEVAVVFGAGWQAPSTRLSTSRTAQKIEIRFIFILLILVGESLTGNGKGNTRLILCSFLSAVWI
jgi:hypothetical protein